MIKGVLTIIKISIIVLFSTAALTLLTSLFNILDFSILLWFQKFIAGFTFPFTSLLDYPNLWLMISYFVMKSIFFFTLDIFFRR